MPQKLNPRHTQVHRHKTGGAFGKCYFQKTSAFVPLNLQMNTGSLGHLKWPQVSQLRSAKINGAVRTAKIWATDTH